MQCAPCGVPPEPETESKPVVLDQIAIQLAALAAVFRDFPHMFGTYQDIVKVEHIRKCFNHAVITNYQNLYKYSPITLTSSLLLNLYAVRPAVLKKTHEMWNFVL
jgi:hypothetical protein